MRQLSASPLPAARPRLRRLSPRWFRVGLRYGTALFLIAIVGGGGAFLWKSGALQRGYAQTVGGALRITADLGLRVSDVVVEGRNETSAHAILAAVGVKRGAPLLALDLAAARARLEALPWVRTASVERRWPHLVFVRIEERIPFALWQAGRQIRLIDRESKVIEGADIHRFSKLPLVVGEGANKQVAAYLDMLSNVPSLERRIEAGIWVGNRRWNIHFANGVEVRLPETDPEEALQRLADLDEKQRLLSRDIVMIDLRLPDRLIVRLSPEAAQRQGKPGKNT